MRFLSLVFKILFLTAPSLVIAAVCIELPNKIYQDLNKYADIIQTQKLPWMNISYLEKKMGKPQVEKMPNNLTQYSWPCEHIIGESLTVITDQNGKIIYVSGQYNLSKGSGMFNASLTHSKTITSVPQTTMTAAPSNKLATQTTQIAPQEEVLKSINQETCQNMLLSILMDIKNNNVNNSTVKSPWMNLSFLNSKFGKAELSDAKEISYEWKNYKLLYQANGARAALGDFAASKSIPTPEKAISVLGQPQKIQQDLFTQYKWSCGKDNNKDYLIVLANAKGEIMQATASVCQNNNCYSTSQTINHSKVFNDFYGRLSSGETGVK